MRAVADSEGKVQISAESEGVQVSLKVASLDGVPFVPGGEVEIPDERLHAAFVSLLAPFGPGPWRLT